MRGVVLLLARRAAALLLLALVSLGSSPAAALVPAAALSILGGGSEESGSCTYVLLDLGSIGVRAGDVVVTIPTGNGEAELPRIPVPSGTHSVRLLKDILYNGSSIYSMSREELAELIDKYHGLPPNATIVDETLVFLETDPNATRILVPLPRLASPPKTGGEWYSEALRRGLDRRTVFRAAGLTLYVYYSEGKAVHTYNPKPPLSLNSSYTTAVYEASGNGLPRAELARYTIEPRCLWPPSKTSIITATIAGTEAAPTTLEEPSEGGFMIYTRPWRTANPKEGSYGALRNQEITGTAQWSAADQFIIRYNTTRYEVWTTITPDRDVWLRARIYINNSLVVDDYRQLAEGVGVSWGVLVRVNPELPGNYIDPLTVIEVKVELTSISDPQATLRLDTHATARAWITPLNSYNLVHSADIQLNGMGEPFLGGDDADDARYLVGSDGAAVFMFVGSNSMLENSISGGIPVSTSPEQKYDRYVSVYINGMLASRCLASNPSVPNGTEGVRRAYCAIYGGNAIEEIIEYFKIGYTPIIKVLIEGFDPDADELWYVEPSHLHVLTRAETIEGSTEYLWRIDPTSGTNVPGADIDRGLVVGGSYMGLVTLKDSNIECTDMQEHLASITFNLPIESSAEKVTIGADVNPTSRGYMGYYHYYMERVVPATYSVEHVSIVLEFHANTELSVWEAVGYSHGGSEKAEELVRLINTGGWLVGIIGLVAGGTYLSLASSFLSTPAFYFTGSVVATSCTHPADNVAVCQLSWNQGSWYAEEEDVSLKMEVRPPADFPWGSGDLVLQYSIQVRSKVTYDIGASLLHRRYITNQYEGTLLLKPVPS